MAPAPIFQVVDYLAAQQALLPRGPVWPRDSSATLTKLLTGFVGSNYRSNVAASNLLVESFPSSAVQLLGEWESTLGLPDAFAPPAVTQAERQAAVVGALTDTGIMSGAYFVALALGMGYAVTISTFRTYNVNVGMDRDIASDEWAFVWQVNASASIASFYTLTVDIVQFTPGLGNPLLESALAAYKPAGTICITRYA